MSFFRNTLDGVVSPNADKTLYCTFSVLQVCHLFFSYFLMDNIVSFFVCFFTLGKDKCYVMFLLPIYDALPVWACLNICGRSACRFHFSQTVPEFSRKRSELCFKLWVSAHMFGGTEVQVEYSHLSKINCTRV